MSSNRFEPSLSKLDDVPLNVQASQKVEVDVITKSPDSDACYVPETQLDVVVEPRDDVTELNITDKGDGKYQVTFLPSVPGKYSVELKIGHEHIQNSPQKVDVKPRELNQDAEIPLIKPNRGKNVTPVGVAVNKDGEIAVVDEANDRILLYSKEGQSLSELDHQGSGNGELNHPCGAAFTADGVLVITDQFNSRVSLFQSTNGKLSSCFGKKGTDSGEFYNPAGVSVDSDGRIIVCDFINHHVQVFDRTNEFLFKFGDSGDEKLSYPYHCVFHKDMFFVTDSGNDCIKVFDNNGEFLYKFGKSGEGDGEFSRPYGLCVDSDNTLIVCNFLNSDSNCVQIFTLDGRFVGKSVQPISGCWEAAKFPDGTIVVSGHKEGQMYFLK